MRYAEWCIAAPSLEADIAAAAMGLDDIGHSRVLYGSLRELGTPDGPDEGSYANVPYLDRPWTDWTQFVGANAVLDSAFSLMIEALVNGNVEVLRSRLRKMLQEERYHYLHGRSWMREANAAPAVERAWGEALEWGFATYAGCCKSASGTSFPSRLSIGPSGMALAGGAFREASTRRRSRCCRDLRKSDTCRRVDKGTPQTDPPAQRGREVSRPGCPFCKSTDVEVISLFGSQVMTMQCKCRACGSYFEASKY